MKIKWSQPLRKFHFWGSVAIFFPVLALIVSGLILQVKGEGGWVPPTVSGQGTSPTATFSDILEAARQVPEAEIKEWGDIDRLQIRPDKGVTKVRAENGWEVQVDHVTTDILHVGYRWVNVVEEIHDGSWFHDNAKLWVFLPSSVILLILWTSGIYLIVLPYWTKGQRSRAKAVKIEAAT
ncbi:MAG: PepSY domain-containing protein [Chloroflexota bacterium]